MEAVTFIKIKLLSLAYTLTQGQTIFMHVGKECESIVIESQQFIQFCFVSFVLSASSNSLCENQFPVPGALGTSVM